MGRARLALSNLFCGGAARVAVAVAAGALMLAHALMLAARLRDASIVEPAIALRWMGAFGVALLAVEFRRRGLPLLRGRSGLVFAPLVLLLHVGASPDPALHPRAGALLVEAPIGLAAAVLIGRIGNLLRRRGRIVRPAPGRRARRTPPRRLRFAADGLLAARLPRPPPAR